MEDSQTDCVKRQTSVVADSLDVEEYGECLACELLVQYCKRKASKSLTSSAEDGQPKMMENQESRCEVCEEEEKMSMMTGEPRHIHTATRDGVDGDTKPCRHVTIGAENAQKAVFPTVPSEKEAAKKGSDIEHGIHNQTGDSLQRSPVTPSNLEAEKPQCANQSCAQIDDLEFSPDTKSLLRRKRALDSVIKGTLPSAVEDERNNSSRGHATSKKRSAVQRMAKELDEKMKLGDYSFLTKPESADHIQKYLLSVGQETEVVTRKKASANPVVLAQSDTSKGSAHPYKSPAHLRTSPAHQHRGSAHKHRGSACFNADPIPSAPSIDLGRASSLYAPDDEGMTALRANCACLRTSDPQGQWNYTSSEESAASAGEGYPREKDEELEWTRKEGKVAESGDMTGKILDPALESVCTGRLTELLKFYEKLEEEALKSGRRTILFKPPYPCGTTKKWRKRSRSCSSKTSSLPPKEAEVAPRSLTAEDADLCKALERMAGDSEVDQTMRTAFLSVVKEIQDQARLKSFASDQPQDPSFASQMEPEQLMERSAVKRQRLFQFGSQQNDYHDQTGVYNEGEGAQVDIREDLNHGRVLSPADYHQYDVNEGASTSSGFRGEGGAGSLYTTPTGSPFLPRGADSPRLLSRSRGDHVTGLSRPKSSRLSHILTYIVVLVAVIVYGAKNAWPMTNFLSWNWKM